MNSLNSLEMKLDRLLDYTVNRHRPNQIAKDMAIVINAMRKVIEDAEVSDQD